MFKVKRLSKNKLTRLLQNVEHILIDCDGVLYRGNVVIKGTPDVVLKLKQMGKKVYFVTNNATKTRKEFSLKCQSMGFAIEEENIINSSFVTASYLSGLHLYGNVKVGKVFCLGSKSLFQQLEEMGLSVLQNELPKCSEAGIEYASNVKLDNEVDCVLVSLDEELTYLKLAIAGRYLADPSCLFVVTNMDSTLPVSGNILLPDAGSNAHLLTSVTGRTPDIVCGKPSSIVFEIFKLRFKVNPKKTLMIGDRLDTDMAFASNCQLKSLLVLTGVSTIEQAKKAKSSLKPDFYLPSLADMSGMLDVF